MRLWKRTRSAESRAELKVLNSEIRRTVYEERKQAVRRQIRPANPKSLWESVKKARDKVISEVPNEMYHNNVKFKGAEIPDAFANSLK